MIFRTLERFMFWAAFGLHLRMNAGADMQSLVMGGGLAAGSDTNLFGTATGIAATTLTNTGAAWTVNRYQGHIVFANGTTAGNVFGVILSNTATVLTIDQWYNATTLASATTPTGTITYVIAPGGAPAWFVSVTENATSPVATDTQLAGELVIGTSAGLQRTIATWAHSAGTTSFTLTKTLTLTGGTSRTLQKAAYTNSAVDSANQFMLFETAIPNPPVLVTNDQVTLTETVNI